MGRRQSHRQADQLGGEQHDRTFVLVLPHRSIVPVAVGGIVLSMYPHSVGRRTEPPAVSAPTVRADDAIRVQVSFQLEQAAAIVKQLRDGKLGFF